MPVVRCDFRVNQWGAWCEAVSRPEMIRAGMRILRLMLVFLHNNRFFFANLYTAFATEAFFSIYSN